MGDHIRPHSPRTTNIYAPSFTIHRIVSYRTVPIHSFFLFSCFVTACLSIFSLCSSGDSVPAPPNNGCGCCVADQWPLPFVCAPYIFSLHLVQSVSIVSR